MERCFFIFRFRWRVACLLLLVLLTSRDVSPGSFFFTMMIPYYKNRYFKEGNTEMQVKSHIFCRAIIMPPWIANFCPLLVIKDNP